MTPLGVSGHYGLPVEGFARAVAAGVDRLFWEPNYATLTDFAARLSPSDRTRLGFVAGSFEAEPRKIRRDLESALRTLRVHRLAVFVVFWVQSWRRIDPAVRAMLEECRGLGLVAEFGLSTHQRPLAVRALDEGWNPVMVRHSAAYRGAETTVFPHAQRRGVGLMTFSSTCYGRLLQPVPGVATTPPTAADCLRYCLAQPAVSLVWTAPATLA